MCEISSKLKIETRKTTMTSRRPGVFNVNFKQMPQIILVFPLVTLNK